MRVVIPMWKYRYNEDDAEIEAVQVVGEVANQPKTNIIDQDNAYFLTQAEAFEGVRQVRFALRNGDLSVRKCASCGRYYFATLGEDFWFKRQGIPQPKRCRVCREKRRNAFTPMV